MWMRMYVRKILSLPLTWLRPHTRRTLMNCIFRFFHRVLYFRITAFFLHPSIMYTHRTKQCNYIRWLLLTFIAFIESLLRICWSILRADFSCAWPFYSTTYSILFICINKFSVHHCIKCGNYWKMRKRKISRVRPPARTIHSQCVMRAQHISSHHSWWYFIFILFRIFAMSYLDESRTNKTNAEIREKHSSR